MVAPLIESVGGAVVGARLVGARGEGDEVQHQSPAALTQFAGPLMAVQAAVGVHDASANVA